MFLRRLSKQYNVARKPRSKSLIFLCCAAAFLFVLLAGWSRPLSSIPSPPAVNQPLQAQFVDSPGLEAEPLALVDSQEFVELLEPKTPELDVGIEVVRRRPCDGRRVYTYDLPSSMNTDLLECCSGKLVDWIDFCKHYTNHGFGAVVNSTEDIFRNDWYGTDAYMLEVIYFERMRRYSCLTTDPREADLFFIPFFAGLDALPYLYTDEAKQKLQGRELVAWLAENATETWERYGGRDHFYIAGRTAWDFSRQMSELTAWGTSLYGNPELANVTSMVLERRPWMGNEIAIPYPVGFHPSTTASLQAWIEVVKSSPRKHLFSFSGALRPQISISIRGILSQQCTDAGMACSRLDCGKIKCSHEPVPIYTSLLQATFCLQPRGDTATRRSVIDSIVAGCIPVFFHKDTAHTQYHWHLPSDYANFSVFIDEEKVKDGSANVKRTLEAYTAEQVEKMRARLIAIMPNALYRHPSSSIAMVESVRDAFDVSVEGMARKVAAFKAAASTPGLSRWPSRPPLRSTASQIFIQDHLFQTWGQAMAFDPSLMEHVVHTQFMASEHEWSPECSFCSALL